MPISLRFAARSNVGLGSKDRNEDSGYASSTMLILADGMGGHAAGDIASSTVVGTLVPLDGDEIGADDVLDQLADRIALANESLREQMDADPSREGMGTTLIVLLRAGKQLAMANIGDSRAYQLREGKFVQITKDHSFVQSLIDEGRITPEEAHNHPQRSLVTRVLTGRDADVPELSLREARIGDRYLLCSDGLSDYVGARTIEEIFTSGEPIDVVAEQLIDIALKGSTRDNVTVVIGEVVDSADVDPSAGPDIVGAAVTHSTTQSQPPREPTPAEKAAALSRSVQDDDLTQVGSSTDPRDAADTDGASPVLAEEVPRRSGRFRTTLATLAVLSALIVAAITGWVWTQSQYYLKDDGGTVAVYQGVDSSFGPLHFSHLNKKTDITTAKLAPFWQTQVKSGISASSEREATKKTTELRTHLCPAGNNNSECTQ